MFHCGSDTVYLLLNVDDIVLMASSSTLLRRTIEALQREFSMKDLSKLHHFLGMRVQRSGDGMLLSQRQFMVKILDHVGIADCKPCQTPVDTNPKLSASAGHLLSTANASDYRSLASALQYLTFTRPDISYVV